MQHRWKLTPRTASFRRDAHVVASPAWLAAWAVAVLGLEPLAPPWYGDAQAGWALAWSGDVDAASGTWTASLQLAAMDSASSALGTATMCAALPEDIRHSAPSRPKKFSRWGWGGVYVSLGGRRDRGARASSLTDAFFFCACEEARDCEWATVGSANFCR